MKAKIFVAFALLLAVVISGCAANQETPSAQEQGCINSGGTVVTSLCCKSADDFPSNCLIGACGCSPDNSHEIKTCDCGEGRCFDGSKCTDE